MIPRPNRSAFAGSLLALAALGGGLAFMTMLRFRGGEQYPLYSTFRSDPLGARALYEILREQPGLTVERRMLSTGRKPLPETAALFFLGLQENSFFVTGRHPVLEKFVAGGGRLVLALKSYEGLDPAVEAEKRRAEALERVKEKEEKKKGGTAKSDSDHGSAKKKDPVAPPPEPARMLDVAVKYFEVESPEKHLEVESSAFHRPNPQARAGSGHEIAWRSAAYFVPPASNSAWRVRYACRGKPVLMERAWGRGGVVVVADTYFLSNEGLLRDLQPEALAALVGPAAQVLFDETHLGVYAQEGVMSLALKYRLHGVLAALLALALLFIWRQSAQLLPPGAGGEEDEAAVGIESRDARRALLRRHIPPRELPRVCFEEWNRTRSRGRRLDDTRAAEMRTELERDEIAGPVVRCERMWSLWNRRP